MVVSERSPSTVLKQQSFSGEDGRFHIDLLISLADARPVLWDKMDDIYNDRIETKKARREVFVFKTTLKL